MRALLGLEIRGAENIPPEGKLIVAVNHVSIIDPPLAAVALHRTRCARFLGKEELFRIPVLNAWMRACGVIPLDRSRGDVAALREALGVLRGGGCMVIFPEGTRSRTGRPGRPRAGVGLLARESGAPVLPARVERTGTFLSGGPLGIRFGKPLAFSGGAGKRDCQDFAEQVMGEILRL
ncbi:MAG: lysophospholipid acyltransferase family protein [Elusimicrobiota bacterium]